MVRKSRQVRRAAMRKAALAPAPLWKRVWVKFKIPIVAVLSLVPVLGLILNYKMTGADNLRTRVYQPLFSDIISVEKSVTALSSEEPAIFKALPELKASGELQRVPQEITKRLSNIVEEASEVDHAAMVVRDIAVREMSARILQARSEKDDRNWRERTQRTLRQMSQSGKGIGDSVSFEFKHEARSRGIDVREPGRPIADLPGGPTFVLRDWLEYPGSLSVIEELWTDLDYLYFDERQDLWYYQLTREDLRRLNLTLAEFLKPMYQTLSQNPEFQSLLTYRPKLLRELSDIKMVLTDRIKDPKRLRDLIDF